jgi:hypothetical protein
MDEQGQGSRQPTHVRHPAFSISLIVSSLFNFARVNFNLSKTLLIFIAHVLTLPCFIQILIFWELPGILWVTVVLPCAALSHPI